MQMEQARSLGGKDMICCEGVSKTFYTKTTKTEVIERLDLHVKENEFLVLLSLIHI